MKIEIRTFGLLKNIIQDTHFEVEENSSLKDLLLKMAKKYGKSFALQVYDPAVEKINDVIGITLNGQFITDNSLLITELKEGDRITFFILLAGG